MTLHWFISRTVRQATQMRKHVRKLINAQRDLLSPQGIKAMEESMQSVQRAVASHAEKKALEKEMENLEKVANKWLKPYPSASMRENVEVLLVALAVAMGIRTFFLQPFKIPTGSMQPTLFGITSNPDFSRFTGWQQDLRPKPDFEIPNALSRFLIFWSKGISYTHVVARNDGALREVSEPTRFLLFNLSQTFSLENDPKSYKVWFPPEKLFERAGLKFDGNQLNPKVFKKGEDIIKMKSVSGDHLFVDRMTFNFRRPKRGEIIVFRTAGIDYPNVPRDQFYIKRLIGLPEDTVKINDKDHLVINGRQLDAATPRFENIYGYWPDHRYCGHTHAGPHFSDANAEFKVRKRHFLVMGDNTNNSLDSRYWGDFPEQDVIGKSFIVYWPINERFGWSGR